MNSTTSTYWQEQQLMDAMIKGVRHKAKTMTSSCDGSLDGSLSPTARVGAVSPDAASDDRVRSWLQVRYASSPSHPRRSLRTRAAGR